MTKTVTISDNEECGYSVEELRTLVAEGEASEMTEFRSAAEVTAEVKRRAALRQRGS